jgi:hypothetical protein
MTIRPEGTAAFAAGAQHRLTRAQASASSAREVPRRARDREDVTGPLIALHLPPWTSFSCPRSGPQVAPVPVEWAVALPLAMAHSPPVVVA